MRHDYVATLGFTVDPRWGKYDEMAAQINSFVGMFPRTPLLFIGTKKSNKLKKSKSKEVQKKISRDTTLSFTLISSRQNARASYRISRSDCQSAGSYPWIENWADIVRVWAVNTGVAKCGRGSRADDASP